MPIRKRYRPTRVSKKLSRVRKKAVKEKGKKRKPLLKGGFRLIFFLALFFVLVVFGIFAYFAKDLPSPDKINYRQVVESTKIYDRTGEILLYEIGSQELTIKRTQVSLEQIPQYLKDATVAIEDKNFYHHPGIDLKGIVRAFFANLKGGEIREGGSTITQQFIKNSILTPEGSIAERTYPRKIKEVILALEMERKFSKDEILEMYFNQIPYGSNAYGAQAAAQTFFNKNVWELSLAEATALAALPRAPTYYSPHGSHPKELKARQEYILDRMVDLNYISQQEAETAKKEKLDFAPQDRGIKAPHFIMYVKEYLVEKYGEKAVERGGLKVYTTLDMEKQEIAEEVITSGAIRNAQNYRAYNSALVAIEPQTGQILAMVGSKDYFGESYPDGCTAGENCLFDPNVNVAISDRQPGSSFKPFVYATAFKRGYTPETILFDLETKFGVKANGEPYIPKNYDGRFRGPVTMRQSLAQSLNVPSVKTLYLAGVNESINTAQDMGITTLRDRSSYGLSLVLGGGEVKLIDEVAAFGVFANDGIKNEKTAILKVETSDGQVLEEFKEQPKRVLEPQVARLINDLLSDEATRAPMFGSGSALYLGSRPVAAKTGTTDEYLDGWTIGYTPSLVAGVWTGNNRPTSMPGGAGIYVAAPIWNEFMRRALVGTKVDYFIEPEPIETSKPVLNGKFAGEVKVKIDKISGKLATDLTPPELIEERVYRQVHNILYYVNKSNPQGNYPSHPEDDPQFSDWEEPVLTWMKNQSEIYNQDLPTEYDDVHTKENQPAVSIVLPEDGAIISESSIIIRATAFARLGIKQLDFFFGDDLIGTDTSDPYQVIFSPPSNIPTGQYTITVRAYDEVLNKKEDSIEVILNL